MVIADQRMDEKTGIEILIELKGLYPDLLTVLTSSSKDLNLIQLCKDNLINGYIFKSEPEEVTINAIRTLLTGENFFSEIVNPNRNVKRSKFNLNPFQNCTKQELQIIRYLAKGYTQKEMAEKMGISSKTVNVHRHNLALKFNKAPTARIVHEAFLWGLLKDEDLL
jgi:DNA-binding NarL/FixJ family response regulator